MTRRTGSVMGLEHLVMHATRGIPPRSPVVLHDFLSRALHIRVPTAPLLPGSSAPFDYLVHSFFEGATHRDGCGAADACRHPLPDPPRDCVVWAARGAGKTFLGAVATVLDLVFKPGIEVRILGGSLEQSRRMHEHLRRLFDRPLLSHLLAERITERRVVLKNGSRAQILAQSQTSVRGTRVQKLRCDEVELFDPEVWEAAQLTTRSANIPGPWGDIVHGSVEALSTMHRPYGLMWKLVADARTDDHDRDRGRAIFRWGLIDSLGRCGPSHECPSCDLRQECAGRAKKRDQRRRSTPGHVSVDDALRMKSRVSAQVWESEMLCLRPRRSDCVFPEFAPDTHVGDWTAGPEAEAPHPDAARLPAFDLPPRARSGRKWVAGMDFGFRSPTVILLGWYRDDDPEHVLHVEAEHVRAETTLEEHAAVLRDGTGDPGAWPSPSPRLEWVGVDPAGHQRSSQTGISSVAVLRKAGLPVRWRRMALTDGLEVVRSRLRPAASGGTPTLFVHRRCTRLIESLQRYHYPEDKPEALEPVKDGSDHAVDALRYLVVCLDRPHTASHRRY